MRSHCLRRRRRWDSLIEDCMTGRQTSQWTETSDCDSTDELMIKRREGEAALRILPLPPALLLLLLLLLAGAGAGADHRIHTILCTIHYRYTLHTALDHTGILYATRYGTVAMEASRTTPGRPTTTAAPNRPPHSPIATCYCGEVSSVLTTQPQLLVQRVQRGHC